MEAVTIYLTTLFNESGNLILLFIAGGIVFNVFTEIIKKQIFPKLTAEESAAGKVQKECPKWLGMIIGIIMTILFTACVIGSQHLGTPHCQLIGGYFFLPIWFVAFYLWQMACMKIVKKLLVLICPFFMTGNRRPPKPQKPKVIKIPAGAVVQYEEMNEENGDVNG